MGFFFLIVVCLLSRISIQSSMSQPDFLPHSKQSHKQEHHDLFPAQQGGLTCIDSNDCLEHRPDDSACLEITRQTNIPPLIQHEPDSNRISKDILSSSFSTTTTSPSSVSSNTSPSVSLTPSPLSIINGSSPSFTQPYPYFSFLPRTHLVVPLGSSSQRSPTVTPLSIDSSSHVELIEAPLKVPVISVGPETISLGPDVLSSELNPKAISRSKRSARGKDAPACGKDNFRSSKYRSKKARSLNSATLPLIPTSRQHTPNRFDPAQISSIHLAYLYHQHFSFPSPLTSSSSLFPTSPLPPITPNRASSRHTLRLINRLTGSSAQSDPLSIPDASSSNVFEISFGDILSFFDCQNFLVVPQRVLLAGRVLEEKEGCYRVSRFSSSAIGNIWIYAIYGAAKYCFRCINAHRSPSFVVAT